MQLTINGQTKQTSDDRRSVGDLVESLGLAGRAVAVEVNRQLIPKRQHTQTVLQDGDVVEVVTLVGGG